MKPKITKAHLARILAAEDSEEQIEMEVKLSLPTGSWLIFMRGARARGLSLEEMLAKILIAADYDFEEAGFRTTTEVSCGRLTAPTVLPKVA